MAMIMKTKAAQEQRIRNTMRSSIWWSVLAFKNNNMALAMAEMHTASEMARLILDDRFVEVAQEQCSIVEVSYDEWFRRTWDAYNEALDRGIAV